MNNFIIVDKVTKEEFVVLSLEPGYAGTNDDEEQGAFYLIANTITGVLRYARADTNFENNYLFKKLVITGDDLPIAIGHMMG